jgi:formyl-CoA transferase
MTAFEAAEAAVAPIYDVADVVADPQYQALGSLVAVADPELGQVLMQNVLFRLSATPGAVRHAGPRLGEHNAEVYGRLGVDANRLAILRKEGVL